MTNEDKMNSLENTQRDDQVVQVKNPMPAWQGGHEHF